MPLSRGPAKYIIQKANKTRCMACSEYMNLLCREDGNMIPPAFYICFNCKSVYRVGVGKVQREE
jgi:uncharacterized protein with PIN domain